MQPGHFSRIVIIIIILTRSAPTAESTTTLGALHHMLDIRLDIQSSGVVLLENSADVYFDPHRLFIYT